MTIRIKKYKLNNICEKVMKKKIEESYNNDYCCVCLAMLTGCA